MMLKPDGNDTQTWLGARLFRKVGAGLVAMGVMMLLVIGGAFLQVRQQQADAAIIDIAARQRALSERIANRTLQAIQGDSRASEDRRPLQAIQGDSRASEDLRAAADLFDRSLHGLRDGDTELGLPAASPTVRVQLDVVDELWQPTFQNVRTVLDAAVDEGRVQELAGSLQQRSENLLFVTTVARREIENASTYDLDTADLMHTLSKRLPTFILEIQQGQVEAALQVDQATQLFDESLQTLLDGDPSQGFPAASGLGREALQDVQAAWEPYYEDVQVLLIVLENYKTGLQAAQVVVENSNQLLQESDKVVTLLEREAQNKVRRMQQFLAGVAIVFLLVFMQTREQRMAELKRAEQALRRSEEHYRSLFEGVPVGLYRTTPEGQITDANSAFVQMIGHPDRESLLAVDVTDLYVNPEDRKQWQALMERQRLVRDFEVQVRRHDGTVMWAQSNTRSVRNDDGAVLYYEGSMEDITERKRTEEELNKHRDHLEELVTERTKELETKAAELKDANIRLQEADRLKSVFLASMSHELRTPLNSIIGFTGVILQGLSGEINEEQRKQLTMVRNSSHHLLSLISEILDIAKIEAGRVEPSLEEFELDLLVREVANSFAPVVSKKGLELEENVPKGITLFSDRRRVKQILMNFVGNAVKFTEEGNVKVTVRITDTEVETSITDTGPGIKEENMHKLFQPFQQVDVSLTKKHEGTGLGLYLSQKLAHLLQGDVWAKSEFGKGSEFSFRIPLRFGEEQTNESAHSRG